MHFSICSIAKKHFSICSILHIYAQSCIYMQNKPGNCLQQQKTTGKCLATGKYARLLLKRARLFAKYAPLLSAGSHHGIAYLCILALVHLVHDDSPEMHQPSS